MNALLTLLFVVFVSFWGAWLPQTVFAIPGFGQVSISAIVPGCGDGVIQTGEQCDGFNFNNQTCFTQGFFGGNLICNPDCTFNTAQCFLAPPPAPPPPPGAPAPPQIMDARVILIGKAHPMSRVTVLSDGRVVGIVTADSLANFRKEIINITPGVRTFGLWAEDTDGNRSRMHSFTTNVRPGMITTIDGIFLPPTISLDQVAVQRGETINIMGQTVPQSDVSIFIDSPEQIIRETKAGDDGVWLYAFNTALLAEGAHAARARSTTEGGLLSAYSQSLAFSVGVAVPVNFCFRADINRDRRVSLVGFSILLFWWGRFNELADINQDRRVNLTDFSIMMYCWTG